jgi:hypothetical protein
MVPCISAEHRYCTFSVPIAIAIHIASACGCGSPCIPLAVSCIVLYLILITYTWCTSHAAHCSFNAEEFKQFCKTLAVVLQQTPILDDIAIEFYHPEVSETATYIPKYRMRTECSAVVICSNSLNVECSNACNVDHRSTHTLLHSYAIIHVNYASSSHNSSSLSLLCHCCLFAVLNYYS